MKRGKDPSTCISPGLSPKLFLTKTRTTTPQSQRMGTTNKISEPLRKTNWDCRVNSLADLTKGLVLSKFEKPLVVACQKWERIINLVRLCRILHLSLFGITLKWLTSVTYLLLVWWTLLIIFSSLFRPILTMTINLLKSGINTSQRRVQRPSITWERAINSRKQWNKIGRGSSLSKLMLAILLLKLLISDV